MNKKNLLEGDQKTTPTIEKLMLHTMIRLLDRYKIDLPVQK